LFYKEAEGAGEEAGLRVQRAGRKKQRAQGAECRVENLHFPSFFQGGVAGTIDFEGFIICFPGRGG
jgi:hypothetical protein